MPKKKYRVNLSGEQRQQLATMIRKGKASARELARARILLKANEAVPGGDWSDQRIAQALEVSRATVGLVRQRFARGGLESALHHKAQKNRRRRRLDGQGEAQLVLLACSQPPQGRRRWTLRLLADRLVALGHADTLSHETVRRVMKKKRAQAVAEKKLVPAGSAQRRVRLRHGGRVERL